MISKLFENIDYLSLTVVALIIYVIYYYYKYFSRVNPLPGPFPFPLFGNLPQLYIWHGGNLKKFFESSQKKYDHIEKLLLSSSKNPYIRKIPDSGSKGFHELELMGKGLFLNQDYKSWRYYPVHWTNELFNELENYWDKLYLRK
ncbi:hypothetical protein RhiirA4_412226, partial [Rhizophagus irregularis]